MHVVWLVLHKLASPPARQSLLAAVFRRVPIIGMIIAAVCPVQRCVIVPAQSGTAQLGPRCSSWLACDTLSPAALPAPAELGPPVALA